MEHTIEITLTTYALLLWGSGTLGSCCQSIKERSSVKPLLYRFVFGAVAAILTVLVSAFVRVGEAPAIQLAISLILGMLVEDSEGVHDLMDSIFPNREIARNVKEEEDK